MNGWLGQAILVTSGFGFLGIVYLIDLILNKPTQKTRKENK